MKTPCFEEHEGCKYATQGGCYADTDHIIPRFISHGASALIKNYIRSQDNQEQRCRHEHDIKTAEEWAHPENIQIPSNRYMIDVLVQERRERYARNRVLV